MRNISLNHKLTHVTAQYICRRFGCTLYEKIQKWIASHLSNVQNQCEVSKCANDPMHIAKKFKQSISICVAIKTERQTVFFFLCCDLFGASSTYQQMIRIIVFLANRTPLNSDSIPYTFSVWWGGNVARKIFSLIFADLPLILAMRFRTTAALSNWLRLASQRGDSIMYLHTKK